MDLLSPAQRQLSDALRAALAEPAEQQWCACEPTECKGVGRCRWQAMSYSPLDKQPAEQEPKNAE